MTEKLGDSGAASEQEPQMVTLPSGIEVAMVHPPAEFAVELTTELLKRVLVSADLPSIPVLTVSDIQFILLWAFSKPMARGPRRPM